MPLSVRRAAQRKQLSSSLSNLASDPDEAAAKEDHLADALMIKQATRHPRGQRRRGKEQ